MRPRRARIYNAAIVVLAFVLFALAAVLVVTA